ncbi:GNAT family N-acetyltransferase [Flavihumibacter rivuli]|uniref:GNAT family N-acetyltransferase n=1 Tax=Flavihumibacter rivuli TaxID=2838156 RepID=UPI001BDEC3F9|nr:GNAT family N-acetyltransferase [Flavihumibacter rivuli]ULQ57233.1 GNAT family N-acetyltransferase [Flavihumibacter rivuli]
MENVRIIEVPLETIWRIRREVMYPGHEPDFVKLMGDDQASHLGLEVDGRVVSVLSLFPEGKRMQFRKFATLVDEQGKGFGTRLLSHVMESAAINGYEFIWCNARLSAISLYRRLGMEQKGGIFRKHGIEYVIMEKQLQ